MDKMLRMSNRMIALGGSIAGTYIFFKHFFFTVDGGERGVIFDKFRGVLPKIYGEGMHLMIPFIQDPKIYEIRCRAKMIHTETGTKDMQNTLISLRILYKPDKNHINTIYLNLDINYDEKVIPSIASEVLKAVVAQYNADQLVTLREKVSTEIKETLSSRLAEFHILLDDVSITHLQFGEEFSKAIEGKQVAQQNAERSKFVVMKNEELKKVAIIKAEGEAEAAKLISESISKYGPGLIGIRKIDAAQEVAEKLSESSNVAFLGNNTLNMLNIPFRNNII